MDKDTKAAFTKLTTTVTDGFAAIDKRFTAVDERFASLDKRFAVIDNRFTPVDKRFVSIGKELHDLTDTVGLIVKNMATKDEVRQIVREELKPIEDRLTSVESKIAGTNRRLDEEAMQRTDLALPKRVSDLEEK